MDREQFDRDFCQAIDNLIAEMADNSNISLKKFYAMTCFMENLAYFGPVLHDMVEKKKANKPEDDLNPPFDIDNSQ